MSRGVILQLSQWVGGVDVFWNCPIRIQMTTDIASFLSCDDIDKWICYKYDGSKHQTLNQAAQTSTEQNPKVLFHS